MRVREANLLGFRSIFCYHPQRRGGSQGAERRRSGRMDIVVNNAAIIIGVAIVLGFAIGVFRVVSGR